MARTTTTTKPAAPNKAQAEFDKYTKRRQAQATTSTGSSPMPPSAAAAAGPQTTAGPFPGSGLTWAVPLGVGTAPVSSVGRRRARARQAQEAPPVSAVQWVG